MNSVRPLVTITILVVVGAYLYVKINEGPSRPVGTSSVWQSEPTDDVPPLDTSAGTQSSSNEAAPLWPAGQASTIAPPESGASQTVTAVPTAVATAGAAPTADVTTPPLPAVPAIPALPEVSATTNVNNPSAIESAPSAVQLPANIPTARYPDQPAPAVSENSTAATDSTTGATSLNQSQLAPVTQSVASPEVAANAEPASPATTASQTPISNPLRQANEPDSSADRFSSVYGANQLAAGTGIPVEPTFAASWPEIQTALNQGKLSQAHQLLSKWYGDPSLTPAEAENVESLLGQLAGTVVYSTDHHLEQARVVKTGETLETIAKEYDVPWRLLAKINGISSPDEVRPGQELKVIRGPFSAVVDMDRKQLTLMLGDRYAGKFGVAIPEGISLSEGAWEVVDTLSIPQQGQTQRSLVLNRSDVTGAQAQSGVLLGAVDLAQLRQQGVGIQSPVVGLSPADADEVADILSVGSRVVIRR